MLQERDYGNNANMDKIIHFQNLSEEGLIKLAFNVGEAARGKEIILLNGDLGAGKTVFSKALAQGFGVEQHVTSPTFTLMNVYETSRGRFMHLDLYRLEDPSEVDYLGIEEYYDEALMAIEWPDRLPDLPAHYLDINIQVVDHNKRKVIIKARGSLEDQLLGELKQNAHISD